MKSVFNFEEKQKPIIYSINNLGELNKQFKIEGESGKWLLNSDENNPTLNYYIIRNITKESSNDDKDYDKSDDIQDTIKYEDHFTSRSSLIAISKQSRTVESEDVQNFLHAKERGIDVELFVRKNKDDKISKEFYYLGRMTATGFTRPFIMPNTDKTAVEIEWKLDTPVREDIYQYIVNG